MIHDESIRLPALYPQVKAASDALNFSMLSDLKTGSLLRTLVASKPGGHFLELGTGTGLALTWMAEAADARSVLLTIDNSDEFQRIARQCMGQDSRIHFICADGNEWLTEYRGEKFDLVFADAWPGKFENLEKTLDLVKVGGFYLVDDLAAHPNWPEGHQEKVRELITRLRQRTDFVSANLDWSTGLMLLTRIRE